MTLEICAGLLLYKTGLLQHLGSTRTLPFPGVFPCATNHYTASTRVLSVDYFMRNTARLPHSVCACICVYRTYVHAHTHIYSYMYTYNYQVCRGNGIVHYNIVQDVCIWVGSDVIDHL